MKKHVAVIGYGGQGSWHTRQILASDVVDLKGIYDILPEKREAAERNGIFAYNSLEAVLQDQEVELVVVAIPNDVHKETVTAALRAHKHVICEKPVEMTTQAFDEMCAEAEQAGVFFTVHQNRRWDVDYLALKKVIRSGEIGSVIRIESRIHGSRGIPSDWRCKKEHGGGMILDWGVHLIDQMLLLIEEPIEFISCVNTYITTKEVDDGFRLTIQFAGGKTGYVEVGTYNFLPLPRFYMQCEKGTLLLSDWREEAQVARLKYWHEKEVLPVQTAAGITKTMAPRDEITLDTYTIPRPVADVHDFYRNVVHVIDGLEEPLVTHAQVRRVMKVMEYALESSRMNQTIPFKED